VFFFFPRYIRCSDVACGNPIYILFATQIEHCNTPHAGSFEDEVYNIDEICEYCVVCLVSHSFEEHERWVKCDHFEQHGGWDGGFEADGGLKTHKQSHISQLGDYKVRLV
jgi:hypothetical protein